jgi:hypothetical protein
MRFKFVGGWCWLILVLLLGLAACAPPAVMPEAAPTATPDKAALHFYEFYSPM